MSKKDHSSSKYLNSVKEAQEESKKKNKKSSPDSCVKCYTMFLPFLLIKIDVFS